MIKKNIPLFYYLPIIIFICSLGLGGLLLLLFGCLIVGLCYRNIIYIYMIAVVILYIVLLPIVLFLYRKLHKINSDIRKNNIIEADVVLKESVSLISRKNNLLSFILNYFFYMKYASCQKCTFCGWNDDFYENYFCFILNQENSKLLKRIYSTDIRYWDIAFHPRNIIFLDGIPLKIFYGAESHVLLKVAPVQDFTYSDEQISIISQFNSQLFEKGKQERSFLRVSSNRNIFQKLINCVPFCLFLIVATGCLLVCAMVAYIYSWYLTFNPRPEIIHFIDLRYIADIVLILIPYIALMVQSEKVFSFLWIFKRNSMTYCYQDIISGVSTSVLSHDGFRSVLKVLFPGKNPVLQKICFSEYNINGSFLKTGKEKFLYYTITDEKYDVLCKLFRCSASSVHVSSSIGSLSKFYLEKGVPLRVIYTKEDSMLREIQPVENYNYTKEQLAAIEKFNTLYP